jgi:hypothetical protein
MNIKKRSRRAINFWSAHYFYIFDILFQIRKHINDNKLKYFDYCE